MGRPHSDLVLPTTKHERVLGLSTLSYKKNPDKGIDFHALFNTFANHIFDPLINHMMCFQDVQGTT